MTLFTSTPGLHQTEWDSKFQQTHLGQAHIAGTGPEGKTCRECKFYGSKLKVWPDYYTSGQARNQLKQAPCGNPIPGKSSRKFPHYARSCSLFDQAAEVPALCIEEKRRG
jgi:hypothetical protein